MLDGGGTFPPASAADEARPNAMGHNHHRITVGLPGAPGQFSPNAIHRLRHGLLEGETVRETSGAHWRQGRPRGEVKRKCALSPSFDRPPSSERQRHQSNGERGARPGGSLGSTRLGSHVPSYARRRQAGQAAQLFSLPSTPSNGRAPCVTNTQHTPPIVCHDPYKWCKR